MSDTRCNRRWQVEAALDGRLSPADVASFERHRATCESCAEEARTLSTLQRVALQLPVLTSTPLERRRLRNELLGRANAALLRPRRSPYARPLAAIVAAATFVIALALWQRTPDTPPAPTTGVPTFELTAASGAEWVTLQRGPTLRLSVRLGQFEVSVDKLESGQRFLLELPDGELEVQGTRFVVEVDGERTQRVHVTEGRVDLRLHRRPPRLLQAGDLWSVSKPPSTAERDATPAPTIDMSPEQVNGASSGGAPRVHQRKPATPKRSRSPADSPQESRPSAGEAFTQATSAFLSGDFGKAERLFVEYEKTHPDDSRTEDAMFLRAVARLRRGDGEGARRIARDYLDRYPNGLRRVEAERLVE